MNFRHLFSCDTINDNKAGLFLFSSDFVPQFPITLRTANFRMYDTSNCFMVKIFLSLILFGLLTVESLFLSLIWLIENLARPVPAYLVMLIILLMTAQRDLFSAKIH